MLEIFPTNGLDHSILTPVFIGLLYITFFAETLGWPFVALVVPGYLSAVFIAAPLSAGVIVVEAIASYVLARAMGIWLPSLGAWTVSFGRDRFFLLIACSVVVRLLTEGLLLPALSAHFEFRHASQLFSVGLVLVPLVANAAWNVGFWRGSFYAAVNTFLTWVTLVFVVLPYTNLGLSKFELTYESVALDFLGAPKAYLLLLAGTVLAARANVMWGWDFNGILVPGLLAVAWYHPAELLSTLVEAMVVALLAAGVISVPPLNKALIEGPRRVLLVFVVGYCVKMAVGYAGMTFWAGAPVTDFYGFGYVLPTLVAVKIWQKGNIPRVILPTIVISFGGFLLGNAVGFAFDALDADARASRAALAELELSEDLAWHLTLQTAWPLHPEPEASRETVSRLAPVVRDVRRGDRGAALRRLHQEGLHAVASFRDTEEGWWVVRRPADDDAPVADVHAHLPALAFSDDPTRDVLLVCSGEAPNIRAPIALALARDLRLGALVCAPSTAETARALAKPIIDALPLGATQRSPLFLHFASNGSMRLSGAPSTVRALSRLRAKSPSTLDLAQFVARRVRWPEGELAAHLRSGGATTVSLPGAQVQAWAASLLEGPVLPLAEGEPYWGPALVGVADAASAEVVESETPRTSSRAAESQSTPRAEMLRLFTHHVFPTFLDHEWLDELPSDSLVEADPTLRWQTALAARTGHRLGVHQRAGELGGDRLLWLRSVNETGLTWVVRAGPEAPPWAIAAPNARRGSGQFYLARAQFEALHVRHFLLGAEADIPVDGTRRRSTRTLHQRALELLLARGTPLLVSRTIPSKNDGIMEDVILTQGAVGDAGASPFMGEVADLWRTLMWSVRWYDGSSRLFPLRGVQDLALLYGRRFAPGQVLVSYWHDRVRVQAEPRRPQVRAALLKVGATPKALDAASLLTSLGPRDGHCDVDVLRQQARTFWQTRHPTVGRALGRALDDCGGVLFEDRRGSYAYWMIPGQTKVVFERVRASRHGSMLTARSVDALARALQLGRPSVTIPRACLTVGPTDETCLQAEEDAAP